MVRKQCEELSPGRTRKRGPSFAFPDDHTLIKVDRRADLFCGDPRFDARKEDGAKNRKMVPKGRTRDDEHHKMVPKIRQGRKTVVPFVLRGLLAGLGCSSSFLLLQVESESATPQPSEIEPVWYDKNIFPNFANWDRARRCDADYGFYPLNPNNTFDQLGFPCQPCEGLGGLMGDDPYNPWPTPNCEIINYPGEIPTPPIPRWPRAWTSYQYVAAIVETAFIFDDPEGFRRTREGEPGEIYREGTYNFDLEGNILAEFDYDFLIPLGSRQVPTTMVPLPGPEEDRGAYDYYHYVSPPIEDSTSDMFTAVMEVDINGVRNPDVCICVTLEQTGPWTYDFLLNPEDVTSAIETDIPTRYLGRELLDVEWIGPGGSSVPTVLDHWSKGPHHFWALLNGTILRMNSGALAQINVLTNIRDLEDSAQQSLDVGPLRYEACGMSNFPGIGCGPNVDNEESTQARLPADADALSRAQNWFPRAEYRGDDFEDMTSTLNIHMKTLLADSVGHRECSDFTVDELNDVVRLIHAARDPELQSLYEDANDPRSLHVAMPAGTTAQHLEDRYMAEKALVAAAGDLEDMMRDGKCHEAVMWFIHHLSTEAQFEIASMIYMPLLPVVSHAVNGHAIKMSTDASNERKEIAEGYVRAITCSDCHLTPALLLTPEVAGVDHSAARDSSDALDGGEIAGLVFAGAACATVVFFAAQRHRNGGDFPYEMNV